MDWMTELLPNALARDGISRVTCASTDCCEGPKPEPEVCVSASIKKIPSYADFMMSGCLRLLDADGRIGREGLQGLDYVCNV